MKNKEKGFTLIELLMTIIIISVVALIAVPILVFNIKDVRKQSKEIEDNVLLKAAETHVSLNRLDNYGSINYDDVCSHGSYAELNCSNNKVVTYCQIFLKDMVDSGALESFPSNVLDENGDSAYNDDSFVVLEFIDDIIFMDGSCVNCDTSIACPEEPDEPEIPTDPDEPEIPTDPDEPETPTDPDEPETPTDSEELVNLISGSCTPTVELQKYTESMKTKYRLIMSSISLDCDDNLSGVTIRKLARLKTGDGTDTDLQFLYTKNSNNYVVDSNNNQISVDSIANYGTKAGDYGTYQDSNKNTIALVGYNDIYNFYLDANGNKVYELSQATGDSLNSDALWSYNTNIYFEKMGFSANKKAASTFIGSRRYRHPFDDWICCDCPNDPVGVSDSSCKVNIFTQSKMSITNGEVYLNVNDTRQLETTYTSTSVDLSKTTYTSSNTNVATVDSKGLVTAISEGTSYISAKNGFAKASIKVTVRNASTN